MMPVPSRNRAMTYKITLEPDFIRAELVNRETVEETRAFLKALVRDSPRYACVLIQVRSSKPIFHVERHGLIEYFQQIARSPQHRIALLADTADLHMSHEYLELIARQHGVNVRGFRSDAEALQWFKDRRQAEDRRQVEEERRQGEEERRQKPRRASSGG